MNKNKKTDEVISLKKHEKIIKKTLKRLKKAGKLMGHDYCVEQLDLFLKEESIKL